jgi:ABC-type dipeptide/oligopeptide/nickel transport system permease component
LKLRYYVLRRLLLTIPTLLGLTVIIFALVHVGGNARLIGAYVKPSSVIPVAQQEAAVNAQLHLNDPLIVQYFYWLSAFLQGNWGQTSTSVYTGPVTGAIALFYPNTLVLAVFSAILIAAIGIPLGVTSAVRKDSIFDQLTRVISFAGFSIPVYWLGLLLLIVFASANISPYLNIFPIGGVIDARLIGQASWFQNGISYPTHLLILDALLNGRPDVFANALMHLVLPVLTLTFGVIASILRVTRSSMQDALNQDYVRTARAKGLSERIVINVHARRNALIPVVTLMGFLVANLLGGVVLTETVFNYLGLGYWATQALFNGDVGGIMGVTVIFGITYIAANLVIDIVYGFIDPRIRY